MPRDTDAPRQGTDRGRQAPRDDDRRPRQADRPREERREAPPVRDRQDRPAAEDFQDLDPGRFGMITRPTADVEIVRDTVIYAQTHGLNVLAPISRLDAVPPDHVVSVRLLRVPSRFTPAQDKARGNGFWYRTDGGGLALTRVSLDRLAQLAGLRDVPEKCGRVDDGSRAFVWQYRHTVQIKDFSGFWREVSRSRTVDLSDGSPELASFRGDSDKIRKARQHGAAACESKAANRAIRAALGILGSYSEEEAGRPFAVPVLVYVPPDDPEVRRMIAAKELGLVDALGLRRPAEREDVIDATAEDDDDRSWERDDDTDHGGDDPWEGR